MKGFRRWSLWASCTLLSGCGLAGRGAARPPTAEQVAQDARVRSEVEARLAAEPSIGAGRVRVVVQRGEVELHGSVAGMGALRCAEANAELTPGVRLVIDFLILEPGPREVRCVAARTAP
jgi:hypothetical protein